MQALLDAGADINQVSAGDQTSPLLIATINGHFDLAKFLLDKGANPNLAADNGATPLYAAMNVRMGAEGAAIRSRARTSNQQTTYLDLMKALLDKGADPNARLNEEALVLGLQLRSVGRRRDRRDAVLARRLRQRRRRDEAARRATAPTRTFRTMKRAGRPRAGDADARRDRTSRPAAGAARRSRRHRRCRRRRASATAKASRPTRIASRPAACSPR